MTVQGAVPVEQLGITLMHEHLFTDMLPVYGENFTQLRDVSLACDEVQRFIDAGGSTIVDVTSQGVGRSPLQLLEVSRATGTNIILGCGYYREPGYPETVFRTPIHRLRDMLLMEIENGVGDTGIKPGIIGEIAVQEYHMTPAFERVLRACGRACRTSGLAISLHDHTETMALEMLDILEDESVTLSRVCMGHQGNCDQLDYLREIANRGAYIQMDHVGREKLQLDVDRARLIAQLVQEGFGTRILLSHDVCTRQDLAKFGGPGYEHIPRTFVPLLEDAGLTTDEIQQILVDNPSRVLAVPN